MDVFAAPVYQTDARGVNRCPRTAALTCHTATYTNGQFPSGSPCHPTASAAVGSLGKKNAALASTRPQPFGHENYLRMTPFRMWS